MSLCPLWLSMCVCVCVCMHVCVHERQRLKLLSPERGFTKLSEFQCRNRKRVGIWWGAGAGGWGLKATGLSRKSPK